MLMKLNYVHTHTNDLSVEMEFRILFSVFRLGVFRIAANHQCAQRMVSKYASISLSISIDF